MTRTTRVFRAIAALAVIVAVLVLAAAGRNFEPANIPVPGSSTDQSYHLEIEFADVLNLPQGATVILGGVRVGKLTKVTVVDPLQRGGDGKGHVVADVAIRNSVVLPRGTTAELRQETPLGDVHIALTEPTTATDVRLQPGDRIPLADTVASVPIEDILARMAVFFGSGAVNDFQSIVRRINGIMPPNPQDTARISGILGSDLNDLAAHTESIDTLLNGLDSLTHDGLLKNMPSLDVLLTPQGVEHTTTAINATIGVIFVLASLGPVGPATAWLGPMLKSTEGAARAVVPMLFGNHPFDQNSPSNMKKLIDLIEHKLIPYFDHGPKVDLVGVSAGAAPAAASMSPDEQTTRIVDTLRMIGAVR